jgi:hypothetical protein
MVPLWVLALYLVATAVAPQTIPRLSVLPAPKARPYTVECQHGIDRWERQGLVWSRDRHLLSIGCNEGREGPPAPI